MSYSDLTPVFDLKTMIFQKQGILLEIGLKLKDLGFKKVAVITDGGVEKLTFFSKVLDSLRKANLNFMVFSEVEADPSLQVIENGLRKLADIEPQVIVSVGGGSSIDAAKALGVCLAEKIDPEKLTQQPPSLTLPHLSIPTTAGTGAEVSNSSILTDKNGTKRAVISDILPASWAILDPDVLLDQPKSLVTSCGLDALSHGIESYVSRESNLMSRMMSLECIRLIYSSLNLFLETRSVDSAMDLQMGALLGGAALKHARLGYAHALGHALAQYIHEPHGVLIGRVLPFVLIFNELTSKQEYERIKSNLFTNSIQENINNKGIGELMIDFLKNYNLPIGIKDLYLAEEELVNIAKRCASGPFHRWNPRRAEEREFLEMLTEMKRY